MVSFSCCETPFGTVRIGIDDGCIISLQRSDCQVNDTPSPLSEQAERQLAEYFAGVRKNFDLPLKPTGTPFQLTVWQALRQIPYGQTRTYGQIAAAIGKPKAARAVGMACNRNPLWILIPCHRVIGSNQTLTGYAGGLDMKRALLELEKS
jgi:methylated-DNA-[protein]-cysteine S-methyltransferase